MRRESHRDRPYGSKLVAPSCCIVGTDLTVSTRGRLAVDRAHGCSTGFNIRAAVEKPRSGPLGNLFPSQPSVRRNGEEYDHT